MGPKRSYLAARMRALIQHAHPCMHTYIHTYMHTYIHTYLDPNAVGIREADTDTNKSCPFSRRRINVSFKDSSPVLQQHNYTEISKSTSTHEQTHLTGKHNSNVHNRGEPKFGTCTAVYMHALEGLACARVSLRLARG